MDQESKTTSQTNYEDLLFRLNIWGDMQYEDGCKCAHDILLEYRNVIVSAIEREVRSHAI